jgi:hypothetical protein
VIARRSWTAADQAELDCLIWELVDRLPEHRERCARCRAQKEAGFPCPHVGAAIDAVLDWRRRRALLSRAESLRLQRNRELERAA